MNLDVKQNHYGTHVDGSLQYPPGPVQSMCVNPVCTQPIEQDAVHGPTEMGVPVAHVNHEDRALLKETLVKTRDREARNAPLT